MCYQSLQKSALWWASGFCSLKSIQFGQSKIFHRLSNPRPVRTREDRPCDSIAAWNGSFDSRDGSTIVLPSGRGHFIWDKCLFLTQYIATPIWSADVWTSIPIGAVTPAPPRIWGKKRFRPCSSSKISCLCIELYSLKISACFPGRDPRTTSSMTAVIGDLTGPSSEPTLPRTLCLPTRRPTFKNLISTGVESFVFKIHSYGSAIYISVS